MISTVFMISEITEIFETIGDELSELRAFKKVYEVEFKEWKNKC